MRRVSGGCDTRRIAAARVTLSASATKYRS